MSSLRRNSSEIPPEIHQKSPLGIALYIFTRVLSEIAQEFFLEIPSETRKIPGIRNFLELLQRLSQEILEKFLYEFFQEFL